jgi:hypothetical protein
MASVNIPIISEFDAKGTEKAVKEFQSLQGVGAKTGFALQKAFVPAIAALGALTAVVGTATKAAMEDQAAQVELARQLKATTQATDAQVASAENFISALSRQTAMADDQLRPALANLVRATGSLELSQRAMAVTADLATAKNIDMETASSAVSKALAGQTAALVKLDPSLKDLIDKSSSADDILKALNNTVGGSAEAFANTAEGGAKNFSIAMGELQESIGAAFLPIMEKMIPILNDVANYMAENTDVIVALIAVIGGLSAAIVAVNLVMKIYTSTVKITQVANTALANSFTSLQTSAGVLATGVGIAAVTLQAFYELFKEGPEAIRQTIQPFKDFALFVGATVATIGNGVLGAVQLVVNGINTMVNAAIDALNLVNPFNDIDKVPMLNLPNIPVPSFGGGSYFGSGSASVGSGAAREGGVGSVLAGLAPITMPSTPTVKSPMTSGGGSSAADPYAKYQGLQYGGGVDVSSGDFFRIPGIESIAPGQDFTININGGLSSSAEIGTAVVNAIRAFNRQNGPANIAVA